MSELQVDVMNYVGRRPVPIDGPWQYWWEYADGTEGGMIWIEDNTVIDYDGAFDMPACVWQELAEQGVQPL